MPVYPGAPTRPCGSTCTPCSPISASRRPPQPRHSFPAPKLRGGARSRPHPRPTADPCAAMTLPGDGAARSVTSRIRRPGAADKVRAPPPATVVSDSRAACSRSRQAACGVTDSSPSPDVTRRSNSAATGEPQELGGPPQSKLTGLRRHARHNQLLLDALAQALVKQMCSTAAPRGHRGGLVSEVAVPGRTAHEGKPASHHRERAFAPSPSGRCGHAR